MSGDWIAAVPAVASLALVRWAIASRMRVAALLACWALGAATLFAAWMFRYDKISAGDGVIVLWDRWQNLPVYSQGGKAPQTMSELQADPAK